MGRNCSNVATTASVPITTTIPYNNYIINVEPSKKLYGWICPVCGRGLSPYVNECSCHLVAGYINIDSTINKPNI